MTLLLLSDEPSYSIASLTVHSTILTLALLGPTQVSELRVEIMPVKYRDQFFVGLVLLLSGKSET